MDAQEQMDELFARFAKDRLNVSIDWFNCWTALHDALIIIDEDEYDEMELRDCLLYALGSLEALSLNDG